MPFIANTPESLIQRSDSRDPAATCRGLTSTGRPCRRPVAGPPLSSPTRSNNTPSESTYCWQHKDQAPSTTARLPQGLQKSTIRERTSIDTLVDRLGLLEVESPTKGARRRRPRSADPAVHVPEKKENTRISEKPSQKPSKKTEPEKTWEFLCCFGIADEEAIARPTRTPNNGPKTSSLPSRVSMPNAQNGAPSRPRIERDPPSRTAELLSLIPREVSPETSAILLAELAKPVSALDEPGFIYIFWLTSESLPNAPPPETTSSLLAPPSRSPQSRRRTSDVLQSFSVDPIASRSPNSSEKKPILLKIGRANNVQRRMNEWQRQCGYNVTLIRFYPYIDIGSSSSPNLSPQRSPARSPQQKASPRPSISSTNTPRKVPNAHKIERLIHLELTGRGMRKDMGGKCTRCGTSHREWFEIEGSRSGLREVDEIIRRWVEWGEREG